MLKMILLNNTLVGNMTGMTGMARVWMHVVSLIRHHDTLNKIKKNKYQKLFSYTISTWIFRGGCITWGWFAVLRTNIRSIKL